MKEFSLPFGPLSSQHCAFCICIMHQARLPHQQEYLFNRRATFSQHHQDNSLKKTFLLHIVGGPR